MPTRILSRPFLAPLLASLLPFSLRAQRPMIECVRPEGADCTLAVSQRTGADSVVVRLTGVELQRTPMTVHSASTLTGGASGPLDASAQVRNGQAVAHWYDDPGTGSVLIEATAAVGRDTIRRTLTLRPPARTYAVRAFTSKGYGVDPLQNLEYWYPERQLAHSVVVEITRLDGTAVTASECPKVLVVFRQTSSGAVSPDSSYGRWMWGAPGLQGRGTCLAITRWKLGKEVGEHHLRAGLPGDPTGAVEFRARARALPRVVAGLAFTRVSSFNTTIASDTTFHITRTTATGGIAYDSVVHARTTVVNSAQWLFTPLVGLDWPLKSSWPLLRTGVSASLKSPTTDWFFGASILQALEGLSQEGVGMDLQGVVHVGKRNNATRFLGAGIVLTFDTGLLSVITTAFPLR